ncbi:LemA family protein, partial [Mycoplasmopsis synoviae]
IQNEINENASLIQIQLAKRADTLTKLVEQVRSYKDFEKETYTEVAKLRNLTSQPSAVENGAEIERLNNSVFGRLMAVAENYTELKASSLYKDLMEN